jgi:hypothetical protein
MQILVLRHSTKMTILCQDYFFSFLTAMVIQSARVQRALTLSNRKFKQLFGVKRETFSHMLEVLEPAYELLHKLGGKPPTKLRLEDRLLVTLQYWREYRTLEHLAYEYDTVVSNIHKAIEWVESTLIQAGAFRLPGKKTLVIEGQKPRAVAIDVTEHTIERPKKQKKHYSGKKKRHTIKTQVVVDLHTLEILFIVQAEGSVHDFTMYKDSTGSAVSSDVKIKVDSGYQGIVAFHANSEVPFKKSKNRPLSEEEKAFNRRLARERIVIEHVNREIKIFKMMSDRYRNRRRRHGLRMNLICAIRNSEIKHEKG